MHVGTEYHVMKNGKMVKLEVTKEEKGLGIYTTNNLKPSMQCTKATSKARSVLGMIRQHFKIIDAEEFHILYDSYIRPHMEYCVQLWSPYLRKNIECLEIVQMSATKIGKGLRKMEYEERLRRLKMTTLENRRLRGDMIETWKILNDREDIDTFQFFQMASCSYNLREHSMRLYTMRNRLNLRRYSFSQRVVQHWNHLS